MTRFLKIAAGFVSAAAALWALTAAAPAGATSARDGADSRHARHDAPFAFDTANYWVDSMLATLTLEERVAQLMMVDVNTTPQAGNVDRAARLVERHKVGGVIFMKGSPVRQALACNRLQALSRVPLLVAMDAETGPAMRLDSAPRLPFQMTLGAVPDEGLVYDMGVEVARQLRRLGVHVNFAPCVDINNNAANPVINHRSFGEDKRLVARRGYAYMSGMQDNGLIVTAKHFPGHGDTDTDSHLSLPLIKHSRKHLRDNEMYPFRQLVEAGVNGVMTAHLAVPAYEPGGKTPASLSRRLVQEILVDDWGFRGLVFTDAMNMGGVAKGFAPAEAALMALKAGNDVILFPPDAEAAIERVARAVREGDYPRAALDSHCRRVLAAKLHAGLHRYAPVDTAGLAADLDSDPARYINHAAAAQAITLVENRGDMLPLPDDGARTLLLTLGTPPDDTFERRAADYARADILRVDAAAGEIEQSLYLQSAAGYDRVVVAWHGLSQFAPRGYGVTREAAGFLRRLAERAKVALVVFGNPYILGRIDCLADLQAVVVAYEDSPFTRDYAAQLVYGGIEARGKLPVSAGGYKAGRGLATERCRLGFAHPRMAGADAAQLAEVDALLDSAIAARMTPGAQLLCARDGMVFAARCYGHANYDSAQPVGRHSLYDLASLTKVLATAPLLMRLVDDGRLDLGRPLGHYIPLSDDKIALGIQPMMSHQAGFKAWYPFYRRTLDNAGHPRPEWFDTAPSAAFPLEVARGMYARESSRDTILQILDTLPLNDTARYLYSDIPYYFFAQLLEYLADAPVDALADSLFYRPMGVDRLLFRPLRRFPAADIMPTENDTAFRRQLLRGYVHDQGAALLGGVSGHAGLFGNALSVAKMAQMYLDKGSYGRRRYLSPRVVDNFTRAHFLDDDNRRGLCFDKPEPRGDRPSPTFRPLSTASYGHSGFTGTFVWVDPDTRVLFVLLANRVCPDASNRAFVRSDIRQRAHRGVYQALGLL